MNPIYIESCFANSAISLLDKIPWIDRTETRRECFMSDGGQKSYTYGKGRGVREYISIDYSDEVKDILAGVNTQLSQLGFGEMNGCFLNCYLNEHQHLGWHADDFVGMDHACPVVSISFGESREIWWRKKGETGVVPLSSRQLLRDGSMFIMPPGMQDTHEHRIPKGDRKMNERVSLTFRRFL